MPPGIARNECAHSRSGLDAVTQGSFWRSDPAAALRGFANALPPAARSCTFSCSNALTGKYISPRDLDDGWRIVDRERARDAPGTVRTFDVMSSPMRPSPRVAAFTKRLRSYVSAHATPSIFSSHA